MRIETDIIIKSFGDYYGADVFGDMSDQVGHALAVLVVHVFQGGYPFPERLARSYKIISRYLDRRVAAPLWRWLFYCGVKHMRTSSKDYDVKT